MLYYEKIYVSERIDINKTSALKECDIFHSYCFLNKGLEFQTYVCNGYHDLLMSMSLRNIVILNINSFHYRCIISEISKNKAMKLMQNIDSTEKGGVL